MQKPLAESAGTARSFRTPLASIWPAPVAIPIVVRPKSKDPMNTQKAASELEPRLFPKLRGLGATRALLAFVGVAITGRAQLVAWNVNGTNASVNSTLNGTVGAGIASATLSLGTGISASSSANTFGGSGFDQTSLSSAITNGDYLQFTISPAASYQYDISSIAMNIGVGTAVTNFNVALFSSATGSFTAGNELWTFAFSSTTPPAQSITLSSIAGLQNLNSPTTFRMYGWRGPSGTSTFRIRDLAGNDLTVNGSTSLEAIPEPSTYAAVLGALGLGSTVVYRRLKAQKTGGKIHRGSFAKPIQT